MKRDWSKAAVAEYPSELTQAAPLMAHVVPESALFENDSLKPYASFVNCKCDRGDVRDKAIVYAWLSQIQRHMMGAERWNTTQALRAHLKKRYHEGKLESMAPEGVLHASFDAYSILMLSSLETNTLWDSDDMAELSLAKGLSKVLGIKKIPLDPSAEFTVKIDGDRLGAGDPYMLLLAEHTQSTSVDDLAYHELIVHPAMASLQGTAPKSVFIGGGGEGFTLREVLTYPSVEEAVMVDVDEELANTFRTMFAARGRNSFDDPRSVILPGDAREYLFQQDLNRSFDAIILDFPDFQTVRNVEPQSFDLGALYSVQFWRAAKRRLRPGGVVVVQVQWFRLCAMRNSMRRVFKHVRLAAAPMVAYVMQMVLIASDDVDPKEAHLDVVRKRGINHSMSWDEVARMPCYDRPLRNNDASAPGCEKQDDPLGPRGVMFSMTSIWLFEDVITNWGILTEKFESCVIVDPPLYEHQFFADPEVWSESEQSDEDESNADALTSPSSEDWEEGELGYEDDDDEDDDDDSDLDLESDEVDDGEDDAYEDDVVEKKLSQILGRDAEHEASEEL
eukprot:TRINITY_DN48821_c0_g1_i1.p1 TRINITY_DN48821_c0_g1~~TRINITY_DN48821_c0_g1_i1.p1  ORF type:complete len:652 (+),score=148.98 TRINITY_DN48821_c0_g1_i1:272-1957(+)